MNLVELQRALRQLRLGGMAAVLEARLLEAQSERGCNHGVTSDGHVVQRVVEAQRKSHNKNRCSDLDMIERPEQVLGSKRTVANRLGQSRLFNFNHGHIDLPRRIEALAPEAFAFAV